jgi:LuxR family maltose regulon positive regulatory protein
MTTLILTTKLYIPRPQPNLVHRPRLIERLNEGLMRKLTLVSAPAGFGKTTLLGEWVRSCGRPVAWISLDENDNDLTRYMTYFVAALQTIEADIGQGVLSAFQAPQPPPIESVLTGLINEIAAVQEQFVLVLDDYHAIEAEAIHNALTFLIDHLPPQMHMVIATRVDPPLPIARLRGRGQLTELRATDLRFTPDEAVAFLNHVMGLDLTADHIAALETHIEGWIAGLQLAALSMQGREDVPGFIAAFTGSQHYILDYLVEEVLQRQSESVRTFLLQTSILDRMTGSLCDAVTLDCGSKQSGKSDGQAMLDSLEHANLFIVPLDDRRHWYRYHRLFADFLRARLHQMWPDQVPALHRRASGWYEQNGLPAAAIDHAMSAGDSGRAADLIEQAAEPTLMHSEVATFMSWVEALPNDVVRARPLLCVYHAWALVLSGHPLDAAESRLQDAIEADTAGSVLGEVTAFRAWTAALRGDTHRSTELSQRALELLPAESSFLRSIVAGSLGLVYMWSGNVAAAFQTFSEAARIGHKAGNLMITAIALRRLAQLRIIQGRLSEARAFCEQALELTVDGRGRRLPIAGLVLIVLGELLLEWNDLEAAACHLVEGIELTKQWGEVGAFDGYVALARVKQAQGDVDGAREEIQKAQQIAIQFDASQVDDIFVALYQARLWVVQGKLEAAIRWAEGRGLVLNACPEQSRREVEGLDRDVGSEGGSSYSPLVRTLEHITLARLCIARDRPDEALEVLESLLQTAENAGWIGYVIEILALQALALQRQGDTLRAITVLERALSLAEPEGYVRILIDEGVSMGELLRQAAARGIAVGYVGKLLAAWEEETKDERRMTKPLPPSLVLGLSPSLVEPLSERELEVLRLIAAGLSNREIAERLVVAVSTVKTHINNIYRKLDVSKRTQAVARASELNLL